MFSLSLLFSLAEHCILAEHVANVLLLFYTSKDLCVFCLNTLCFSWIFIRICMILIQILKHNKYIGGCNVIGFIGMIIVSVPDWGTRHLIIDGICHVLSYRVLLEIL